ncbi:MAG: hypothetical protein K9K35_10435 [Rhodoferax sp.]|nr:hypothetical protein [Rhodoferax sp.]
MTPEQHVLVSGIALDFYPRLHDAMHNKKQNGVFEKVEKFAELAFSMGLLAGLDSEAKAWAEVNRLEDLLVDLLRYAPDSDVAKARKVEQSV